MSQGLGWTQEFFHLQDIPALAKFRDDFDDFDFEPIEPGDDVDDPRIAYLKDDVGERPGG